MKKISYFRNHVLFKKYILASLLLFSFLGTGALSSCSHSLPIPQLPETKLTPEGWAYQKVIEKVQSPELKFQLEVLKTNPVLERDKIVLLNVLGFLSKANYSLHYSKQAVQESKKFLKSYLKTFVLAETKFHVEKEAIAALLWVETKHGRHLGKDLILSTFFSLAQADHPQVLKMLYQELPNKTDQITPELLQKVRDRCATKSQWAIDQILAIDQIIQKYGSWPLQTRGSFAGAFGLPQFIPSSYLKYAKHAPNNKALYPNLFTEKDTIFSVAYYLQQHGWKLKNRQAQSDALFEYNRIRDYGDVILKIAQELQSSKKLK